MVYSLPPDQERVRSLLADTIKLLCKNGLSYKTEFCLNGVIGITLDCSDVFLVDIRETVKIEGSDVEESNDEVEAESEIHETPHKKRRRKRKERSPKPVEDSPPAIDVIEIPDLQFQEELAMIKTEETDVGAEAYQEYNPGQQNMFPMSDFSGTTSSRSSQPNQLYSSHAVTLPPSFNNVYNSVSQPYHTLQQKQSPVSILCLFDHLFVVYCVSSVSRTSYF